jgi:large subunit ribosomal protein L28
LETYPCEVLAHHDHPESYSDFRTRDDFVKASILLAMAKICHVCAKGPAYGNSRSHSMVATRRRFEPNLQRVRIDDAGTPRRVYVCTRCLKAGKVTKAR